MKLSPFIFILIKNGSLILWDYKLHNQFEITTKYLEELIRVETQAPPCDQKVFFELMENKIIVNKDDVEYFDKNWEWDDLSKIFHIGTQDIDNETLSPKKYSNQYLIDCEKKLSETSMMDYERTGEQIKLSPIKSPEMENAKLLEIFYARKTSRNFNRLPISIKNITILLEITFADSNRDKEYYHSLGLSRIGQRKTSPSGGGLHPSEAYLLVQNVDGLEKGIYHFNSKEFYLTKIETSNKEINMEEILNNQYFANDLSAGIFITSVFNKQWCKYKHSRAYRIALLDVGHLSQTLLLSATALGLSTWVSGAFNDTKVSKLLKIDSICERPIFFVGLGYGTGSSVDDETLKILGK